MRRIRHADMFSGLGGFALAIEKVWPDAEHIFCDIDPFAREVLRHHWPEATIHEDIKKLKGEDIGTVDILTGGFPCQPFSVAGKRRGTEDDRHLWPEMLRVIRETRPRWVIGENVYGLVTWNGGMVLEGVLSDLEAEGYKALPPIVLPAASLNAPHKRNRVWIIAYANRDRLQEYGASGQDARPGKKKGIFERHEVQRPLESATLRTTADAEGVRHRGGDSQKHRTQERKLVASQQKRHSTWSEDKGRPWNAWPEALSELCPVYDGLPGNVVRLPKYWNAGIKGGGNAIVPQIPAEIFRIIREIDHEIS